MSKEDIVMCPNCGNTVEYIIYETILNYKGVDYYVKCHAYDCGECEHVYQTDSQTLETLSQIPEYLKDTDKPIDI